MKEFAGKRILFIVENLSVPFDKRVWREACAMRDAGAIVSVISPCHEAACKKLETLENITVYRYEPDFSGGSSSGYVKEYVLAFIKIFFLFHKVVFSQGAPDVIHAANPPDIFCLLGLYAKLFGSKFIFDEHDSSPETYLSRFNRHKRSGLSFFKVLTMMQHLSYKCADAIISTNESYREKAVQVSPEYAQKTFVVRNGPDTRYFKSREANPALKKGFTYMCAYIGIMARQDGVDYIIRAMDDLVNKKKRTDIIVYLIGSGDDLPYLKKLTDELGLNKYIVFTGRIPDDEALEILSTADIGLSPDPYNPLNHISTMNKIMEFMTLGKAIVSFDLKEARFSAQDSALYVENNNPEAFAEGILKLLSDRKLSDTLGAIGKARVENALSWQKQIANLLKVYTYVTSNQKVRVCVLRHGSYPHDVRVLKEVKALLRSGFAVDVICLKAEDQKLFEVIDGARVYRLPHSHKRGTILQYLIEYALTFFESMLLLLFLQLKHRYAVIQVNTLPDWLVFAAFFPKLLGAKVILDLHEPTPELWIAKYGKQKKTFILKVHIFIEQLAIKYASHAITVNSTIRNRFIERGAQPERLSIVRNVPDQDLVSHAGPRDSNRQGRPFTIITHGTIEHRYGHELLIQAIPLLKNKISDLKILVVGDGEEKQAVLDLAEKLHCLDSITFTGYVPFDTISDYIQSSDIGIVPILPSPFAELCQPNKLFEYVALDIPAVIPPYDAITELFDSSCVKFFKAGDPDSLAEAIYDLYMSSDLRQSLALNAKKKYDGVCWSRAQEEYVGIFKDVLKH